MNQFGRKAPPVLKSHTQRFTKNFMDTKYYLHTKFKYRYKNTELQLYHQEILSIRNIWTRKSLPVSSSLCVAF